MLDLDAAILTHDPEADAICRMRMVMYDIPPGLYEGLRRYLVGGIKPGSFLTAVLENNLQEAVLRASPVDHLLALPLLVRFLFNEAPAASWGTSDKVTRWIQTRRAETAHP